MRTTTSIMLMIFLLLGGCGSENDIKDQLKKYMNDPESAQFKDFVFGEMGIYACVMVNEKGPGGGYLGWTPQTLYKRFGTWMSAYGAFPDNFCMGSDQLTEMEADLRILNAVDELADDPELIEHSVESIQKRTLINQKMAMSYLSENPKCKDELKATINTSKYIDDLKKNSRITSSFTIGSRLKEESLSLLSSKRSWECVISGPHPEGGVCTETSNCIGATRCESNKCVRFN